MPADRSPNLVSTSGARLGVFGDNKSRPFHRWYPFIEGYSADLVEQALSHPTLDGVIFDPFGGSGTTALTAAMMGHDSAFTEVNPYMAWIADVKVNQVREVAAIFGATDALRGLSKLARDGHLPKVEDDRPLLAADRHRNFFPPGVAETVLALLAFMDEALGGAELRVARLAVATSIIPASLMVRRTDLRRRTPSDPPPVQLRDVVARRLVEFAEDIDRHGHRVTGAATKLGSDVRAVWAPDEKIGVVVTSPPYLNGTNYFRNSKLELLALDMIDSEAELNTLRVSSISAGINNVSKRRREATEIACVEEVARKLDAVTYDIRIPTLVRSYFADMALAFAQIRKHAVSKANMFLDIGDSRYCGIHVPTDKLLAAVAQQNGWRLMQEQLIRKRRSYDGSGLVQVLLHFEAE